MADRVQEIELPGGATVLARVSAVDALPGSPYADVGVLEALEGKVAGLLELIRGVGDTVRRAAESAAPREASVTFGVELAVSAGKAVAVLADGGAKASLSVTLTWRPGERPGQGTGERAEEVPGENA